MYVYQVGLTRYIFRKFFSELVAAVSGVYSFFTIGLHAHAMTSLLFRMFFFSQGWQLEKLTTLVLLRFDISLTTINFVHCRLSNCLSSVQFVCLHFVARGYNVAIHSVQYSNSLVHCDVPQCHLYLSPLQFESGGNQQVSVSFSRYISIQSLYHFRVLIFGVHDVVLIPS